MTTVQLARRLSDALILSLALCMPRPAAQAGAAPAGAAPKSFPRGCGVEFVTAMVWDARVPAELRAQFGARGRPAREQPPCRKVKVTPIPGEAAHPAAGQFGLFAAQTLSPGEHVLDYVGFVTTDDYCNVDSEYVAALCVREGGRETRAYRAKESARARATERSGCNCERTATSVVARVLEGGLKKSTSHRHQSERGNFEDRGSTGNFEDRGGEKKRGQGGQDGRGGRVGACGARAGVARAGGAHGLMLWVWGGLLRRLAFN